LSFNLKDEKVRAALLATLMSLASMIIILKYYESDLSWETLSRVQGRFLLLGLVLHMFSWIFYAVRLKRLTSLAGHEISFRLSLISTLASNFLAALTPSSAGGEPLRIKILADDGMSYGSATAVAVGERLLDSVFFVAALAFLLVFSNFLTGFGLKIGVFFFVLLILLFGFLWQLVSRPDRIAAIMDWLKRKTGNRPIINSVEREICLFRQAGIHLAKETVRCTPLMAILTTLIWICDFLVPSALLMGMGADPNFLHSVTAQTILAIIAILPLTPGGSGVAELSMSILYSKFVPPVLLGPLVILWRAATYFSNIVVGAAFAGASINGMVKKEKAKG